MIRAEEIQKELTGTIIPFWHNLRDDTFGGYYGCMDFDFHVDKEAEKGCILNSRILWFFSHAYTLLQKEELLSDAKHAFSFLKEHCLDEEYGGVFWSVNYKGDVADSTKHTYNQAFAIYALSAYYEASKEEDAKKIANQLFERIESTCTDEYGYLESFNRKWELEENDKLSENGLLADKTMNTLLHVAEAYTELLRVTSDEKVKKALLKSLSIFIEKVYSVEKGQLEVFFDEKMNTISDLYSYGHDIEASWLLDRACEVLKACDLSEEEKVLISKIHAMTKTLVASVLDHAICEDGAMNNECFHGVVDTTRVWWVQAEAILGFYNGYQNTGNQKYCDTAEHLWSYIKKYIIDHRDGGEWYWDVDASGTPSSRKNIVEPWKCPYHNGRMCMEMIKRLGE